MGKHNPQRIQRASTFSAKFESLEEISAFIGSVCELAGMDDASTYQVQLSVDEACSNIIEHAYYDAPKEAKIECKCLITDDELRIQLHDHGHAFNPLSVPTPDITASLEERTIGGLGIFLMRHFMDKVIFRKGHLQKDHHASGEDGNYLTLVKYKRASK